MHSSREMASSPAATTTSYGAVPFSDDPCRTYRVFPSKNRSWTTTTTTASSSLLSSSSSSLSSSFSSSPPLSPLLPLPPFDPAVLAPLGDFRVCSAELLFLLFDFMDFASLGKLAISSSMLNAKIAAYFETTSGRRRLAFLESLHGRQPPAVGPTGEVEKKLPNVTMVRDLGLYLKRSSCLTPTRDRLPELHRLAAKLNCFTVWNFHCRKNGFSCDGLSYLGELFHTFIAGWEDAEAAAAFDFVEKNCGLGRLAERLADCQPGNSSLIELQFRSLANKVFLRNGNLCERDLAFWLTQILGDRPPKTQAYFLYVAFGPVGGASPDGTISVRWTEMGESTPPSPGAAREWFRPLAKALRSLHRANHAWTSREVLTLMHEITVLHGDTWLLENAACLLLECGSEMIEDLLMSRVSSKKVSDIGAWIAALSVAVVHFDDKSRTSLILSVARKVLLSLGNDAESRQALFDSISNTFQEFVIEYAELMTEDEERLKDLKKILRGQSYFQIGILNELANHLPSRRSVRVGKAAFKIED